jgi:tetratricopeptide (TPR) repeat protein
VGGFGPCHRARVVSPARERDLGHELTLAESSAYWRDLALDFAREHPTTWLRLLLRKLYLYLQAYERGDNTSFYFMRGEVPYLRLLPVSYGIVAPLALAGVWLTRRTWARTGIVPLFALAYASGVILYFVLSRYRLPGVPPLILLAAAAAAWGWETWRAGGRRRVAGAAGAVAALGLLVNMRTPLVIPDDRETIHNNYGLVLEESGKIDEAAQHFATAARLEPEKPLYHYNLAKAERRRGRADAARRELETAIRLDPAYSDAHAELGFLLEAAGETAAAIEEYRRAVGSSPPSPGPPPRRSARRPARPDGSSLRGAAAPRAGAGCRLPARRLSPGSRRPSPSSSARAGAERAETTPPPLGRAGATAPATAPATSMADPPAGEPRH